MTRTRRFRPQARARSKPTRRVTATRATKRISTTLPLGRLLTRRGGRLADLLPQLHKMAVEAAAGVSTLLLERNPRGRSFVATSGSGTATLPHEAWQPRPDEQRAIDAAFAGHRPVIMTATGARWRLMAGWTGTRTGILAPLQCGSERIGILALGLGGGTPPADVLERVAEVGDGFAIALSLARARRRAELQAEVRELLREFSDSVTAVMNVSAGLDIFCEGANRLFCADRTSVWIHERQSHGLVLQASSNPETVTRRLRVAIADKESPAAIGMRQQRAEIASYTQGAPAVDLTIPLRGTRRALGAVVFEGVRLESGGEIELLDRADELGRQLSNAIENLQLLDEVMRARRELENTFDSIADLVVVCDRQQRVVHVNRAFAARAGVSREAMLERPLSDFLGASTLAWLAGLGTALPGGGPATTELQDAQIDGAFLVTVTDLMSSTQEPVGRVIVARDITPQARLASEREGLRRRLAQSEKLAALGQFVAGIAHELNNPLQGVLGHLELMRTTGAIPKAVRSEIRVVYREADRAAKIVRNLLVFAGSRRARPRQVSVPALLQRVLTLRAKACRSALIEVVRHYGDDLPRVPGDPLMLQQAFLNIVMNAEHALAAAGLGGRIEVGAALAPTGDRVVVTIRDTGPGIPEESLPRIFEPFYTTKEVGKGTGLGLAITYGIIQEHGGQILAANHPDGGAAFTIELPAPRSSTPPTRETGA